MELGFEPKTHSLEGCCSIQLSYSTKIGEDILHSKPLISPNINFLKNTCGGVGVRTQDPLLVRQML